MTLPPDCFAHDGLMLFLFGTMAGLVGLTAMLYGDLNNKMDDLLKDVHALGTKTEQGTSLSNEKSRSGWP
jgi:hypothetical protein